MGKDQNIGLIKFLMIFFIGIAGFCMSGCDQIAGLLTKTRAVGIRAARPPAMMPEDLEDINFAKNLTFSDTDDIKLKRNFFRPLVGPGSLREELALLEKELGLDEEAEEEAPKPIVTPETLNLILMGVLMSEQNIAYVSAPDDDFVLRVGDRVSTMTVQDIQISEVLFLLEDGQTAILSNTEEE